MLTIRGAEYRLCGLDTNIFSGILRDRHTVGKGFLTLFAPNRVIPCFSPYTILELRRRRDIYEAFLDFFDVYPCGILKSEEQLFADELASYPEPSRVDPFLLGFSYLNKPKGTNLRSVTAQVFRQPEVLERERIGPQLQDDLLAEWLSLKKNFPPKERRYTKYDALRFVAKATPQHVSYRALEWVQDLHSQGQSLVVKAFPSVRMTLYTVFFRFYEPKTRKAEPQDVFDVLISTPAPYLDIVVTENFQAEIYHKVSRLDPMLRHLEVFTLRDLRAAGTETYIQNTHEADSIE